MQVTVEDLRAWLADHDIDMSQVRRLDIGAGMGVADGVWLRVTRYVLNEEGHRFMAFIDGTHDVAQEVVIRKMHSFPVSRVAADA